LKTHILSAKPLVLACSLLAATAALAEEDLSCQTTLGRPLAIDSPLRDIVLDNPQTIQLEAGRFQAQMGEEPTAIMSGGVLLRRDDLGCIACQRKTCPLGHHRCMRDIGVDEVIAAGERLLAEHGGST